MPSLVISQEIDKSSYDMDKIKKDVNFHLTNLNIQNAQYRDLLCLQWFSFTLPTRYLLSITKLDGQMLR